jgi:hypothetical protein
VSPSEPLVSGVHPQTVLKMLGIEPKEESQACGTIGLVTQQLARYTDFWLAYQALMRPASTAYLNRQGMDVTGNYNGLITDMRGDWLWILGDDHTFAPDILVNLLSHEVDVVVPLVLKKDAPFDPVVYEGQEGQDEDTGLPFHRVAMLPQSGLHEIYAAGSAGMLIRKHVLDALDRPVFTTSHGVQNEDLLFCQKVREAGFKIWCDVDQKMGHIGIHTVYPMWEGSRWGSILDFGNGHLSPYFGISDAELDEVERELGLEPAA